ncbi:hypothetical protein KEM54_001087 [Ascosphaera aggregata]|nr:hypothetical protein KEM54_001087 [Ascosphaera aggregata]
MASVGGNESRSLMTTVKVGSLAGICGLAYGGVSGVIRGRHPAIRSIAMGIQWSLRNTALTYGFSHDPTPMQRASVSAVAGGISGGATTIASFIGQKAYDAIDDWQLRRSEEEEANPTVKKPLEQRLLESKWTLLKPLSDAEYIEMLEDRKTQIEVEIALVEEKLAGLKRSVEAESEEASSGLSAMH